MFVSKDDPSRLSLSRLEEEIGALSAEIYASTCRWLLLIGEFDRRGGHAAAGFRSTTHWLAWYCGLTQRAAREHVRVARALGKLPLLRAHFARGELSYSKVRTLTRIAVPANEEELVEVAGNSTAAQLERIVRAYGRATAEGDAERAEARRHLVWSWEEDGSLSISGRSAGRGGGAVPAGARGGTRRDPTLGRRRGHECRRAHGHCSHRAGARPDVGASASERYQVLVHVDAGELSESTARPEGRCQIERGPAITRETARRIACDASVTTLREAEGRALSIGRKRRAVPPSLRRALRARDSGCRFPGCENHRFVDAHHIHHWADGGETSVENLVMLCRRHHRLLHEGGFTLERRGSEFLFRRPDGRPLPPVPVPAVPRSRGERPEHVPRPFAPAPVQPLDLDHTMICLLQRSPILAEGP